MVQPEPAPEPTREDVERALHVTAPDGDGFPPSRPEERLLIGRFQYYMDVDVLDVPALVARLAWPQDGYPNGSSVIIDANAPCGMRRIWLSEASRRRLDGCG